MGMYTKLSIELSFKDKLQKEVITALEDMVGDKTVEDVVSSDLPKHELFKSLRWNSMLWSSSYYHTPFNLTKLHYDDVSKRYYLISSSDFKNYNNEINLFFDFIKDYVEEGFLGYSLYECDEVPTLYYLNGGNIVNKL